MILGAFILIFSLVLVHVIIPQLLTEEAQFRKSGDRARQNISNIWERESNTQSPSLVNLTVTVNLPYPVSATVTINSTIEGSVNSSTPLQIMLQTGRNYTVSITKDFTYSSLCTDYAGSFLSWNHTLYDNPLTLKLTNNITLNAIYGYSVGDFKADIQIDSPKEGAIVSGIVTVNTTLLSSEVTSVTFSLDGKNLSTVSTANPYNPHPSIQLDSGKLSKGSHRLSVYAEGECSNAVVDFYVGSKPLTPSDFAIMAVILSVSMVWKRKKTVVNRQSRL